MKSVSSSELRAVLASSAFAKCYESVKIEREGNVCMVVRLTYVCIRIHEYQYVSAHSPTHSRSQSFFFFFFEVINNTIAAFNTNTISRQLVHDISLDW